MIQELFLYDPLKGLFKEILNQSTTIKGRYYLSANGGQDLNANNINAFINDSVNLLAPIAETKYPLAMCLTPRSKFVKFNGGRWEQFFFNMFFLNSTGREGDEIKLMDADTLESQHHVWYDWQDMKTCAEDFIEVLKLVIAQSGIPGQAGTFYQGTEDPLRKYLAVDNDSVTFTRVTNSNNAALSGCFISFMMLMSAGQCELADYVNIEDIVIPPLTIHDPTNDK